MSRDPQRNRYRPPLGALVSWVLVGLLGCDGPTDRSDSRQAAERRARQRQAAQTDALLGSIATQLRSLPEAVQMDLTPPQVVVDSRSSTDGEDIEAVVVRPDGVPPEAPANLLRVLRRNGRFRAADVRSGDTVKYFAKLGRETQERIREAGDADIVVMDAFELPVAQVLSDNELLIVGGFGVEIDTPFRLEIWRNVDDRMQEIGSQLAGYANRRDPPLAWHPSPDEAELRQLHERINQWLRQSGGVRDDATETVAKWLATLPETLREGGTLGDALSAKQIATGPFRLPDSRLIQQQVWLRDIARRVRGASVDAAEQASALFDWTVRNIALIDPAGAPPYAAWEAMLHGVGTAEHRAWVFVGLCRQAGLTAFALPVDAAGDAAGKVRTLVGVLDEQRVLIFDPRLGLPLSRTPGSPEADASLAELVADAALLTAYDLPEAPYAVTAEALAAAAPRVVASAFTLAGRARTLEARLTGRDAVRLATKPDTISQAIAAAMPGAPDSELWAFPFETLRAKLTVGRSMRNQEVKAFLPFAWRPTLWKGRVLAFRGQKEAEASRNEVLADPRDDLRDALKNLRARSLRPKDTRLATVASGVKRDIYTRAKAIATYWLATTAIERGDYRTALTWLGNRVLTRSTAERLATGVAYSRARALEGQGDLTAAANVLEASTSLQSHGDRLRAAWLRSAAAEQDEAGSP